MNIGFRRSRQQHPPEFGAAKPISLRNDLDYYGASAVAARYCGIPFMPIVRGGSWSHGWFPDYISAEMVPIFTLPNAQVTHWTATETQAKVIAAAGYRVRAIGLPVVYVKPPRVERSPGTLLVMPIHSLEWSDHPHWKFARYADEIEAIRHRFARVVVQIHPSCIRKGYWVTEFERRGFEIIPGFEYTDASALERMARRFEWAEFVTTNGFGSHLVYSALFGAKPTLYGHYAEVKPHDLRHDQGARWPGRLQRMQELLAEDRLREEYPFLWVSPDKGTAQREWAARETGVTCRLSPTELRREFGWQGLSLLKRVAASAWGSGQIAWAMGPGRVQRGLRRRVVSVLDGAFNRHA